MHRNLLIGLILTALAAQAQSLDVGVIGGGALVRGVPVEGAPGGTTAGFQPGGVGGLLLGQDLYNHWSGEIRYLFEQRDLRVASGGQTATLAGQAHVLYYDVIYSRRTREQRVHPYLAVGGGAKWFVATGPEVPYRPLMQYAYLTKTNQPEAMLSVGGGVKWPVGRRMALHLDARDQITRLPQKLLAPAPGMSIKGWLNDIVPTVGLSWRL